MPDYNLGRARGHIEIDADTRGVDDARQAMRGAGEQARQLDARLREVQDRYGSTSDEARRASEAVERHQVRIRNLQREYGDLQSRLTTVRNEIRSTTAGTQAHTDAREREARIVNELIRVYGSYENTMRNARREIGEFGDESDRVTRRTRDFRDQINDTDRTVRTLANSITSVLMPAMKSMMMLGAVGAGGGLLGLLGAGGAQGIVATIGALASVISQLSGAVALLPAAMGGAVAVMGVFTVAMHGVSDAMSAAMANDPKKFAEAIKDMGPAAQSVMMQLASFTDAFKGAMRAVQDSFFQPLVGVIEPLIRTWLPMLQTAGQQIANVLGRAGATIANWLQQANTMSGFQEFVRNLVTALERLLPAFQPFADAFLTLTRVGSQFLPQIADSIVKMANSFNNMVQSAAADGSLQRWISGALEGFSDLWDAIKNIGAALGNIGSLSGQSGGFLQWLADITAQFRAWTESAEGAQTIQSFFTALSQAGQVLAPILRIIGGALAQVAVDLTTLGTNMGPGLTTFFQGLAGALGILGQALVQSGPALNQILSTLGEVLLQVMASIGPQLPGLFQDMADVIQDLAPIVVTLAGALADLLSHLTPTEIEIALGLVAAFQAMSTVLPIVIGAIGGLTTIAGVLGVSLGAAAGIIAAVVVAVGLLVAAIIYCATHWDQVKGVLNSVWESMKAFGSWIATTFSQIIKSIGDFFVNMWNGLRNTVTTWWNEAYEWGRGVVDRFIAGIKDMFQPLSDAWDWLTGGAIDDKNPHSPPKKGPLSGQGDPLAAGQRVTERFASGIEAGAPAVDRAYSGAIGMGDRGTPGSGPNTGTAVNPNFGGGSNGMNQWAAQLQKDLSGFLNLVKSGFGLFEKVADIFVKTTTVVASIWGGGDNPLTRPGGIFGQQPGLTPQQQRIPGVENLPGMKGVAPDPSLTPQGNQEPGQTPVVPQQQVPGVGLPGANPPVQTQGQAPPSVVGQQPPGTMTVPLTRRDDGTYTSPNAAWAHLLERESNGRPDAIQGNIGDINNQTGDLATGMFQITGATWRANGGEEFAPSAREASPEQQAIVASRILGSDPGAWGFYRHPGREDPAELRAGLTPLAPPAQVPAPQVAPPPAGVQGQLPANFPITDRLTQNHGGQIDPNKFLVHTSESDMGPTELADWMNGMGDRSYNYLIDPNTGAITRAVPAGTAAWAVGSPGNQSSINAVVAGSHADWSREEWLQRMPALQSLAWLAARDAQQFGIPTDQLTPGDQDGGIGGHDWVSRNLGGSDHTDPGPNFPWQEFMGMVQQYSVPGGARPDGVPNIFPGYPEVSPPRDLGPQRRTFTPEDFGGIDSSPVSTPLPAGPAWSVNPASRARIPLGGSTTDAVRRAGLPRLYNGTEVPPEIAAFAKDFGLTVNTRTTGGSLHEAGFAFDINGKPEDLDRFAEFIQTNMGAQTLELIHMNERTGQKWGIAGGQDVRPGSEYANRTGTDYFGDDYASHGDYDSNAHVHWATDVLPVRGGQPVPQRPPGQVGTPQVPTGPSAIPQNNTDDDWMQVPNGWDINQPIPMDVRRQHGIPDEFPPMYYAAQPGTVTNVYAPDDPAANNRGVISVPLPGAPGGQPGFPETQQKLPFGATTPMGAFQGAMSSASSIAADAFAVFDNVIKSIGATANILDSLVRGPSSTEDIMSLIDNFQQYITTAASVAKLVGSIGGMVGGAGSGDPTGMTGAVGGGIQAIAGIVQSALEATNMAIDFGQEVWHQVSKYGALFAGTILGGENGFLGGDVRMLLNTATGEIQAYSEQNPDMKTTHNMPDWLSRAYGGTRPETQPPRLAQVNIYSGPGQTPRDMMNESMWLVNNDAAAASIAGAD